MMEDLMDAANPVWGDDWPSVRSRWDLDPAVAHCNHGSFGAVPRDVLAAQHDWGRRIQRNPVRFYAREITAEVNTARDTLAEFVGADAAGSALLSNATTAAAVVFGSVRLAAGDEILVTDHGYGAILRAAQTCAQKTSAKLVVCHVPLAADDETWVDCVLAAVGPRTRLVLLDTVTSPTARAVPVARLVRQLRSHDVIVVVDAAHGPGLTIDPVGQVDADFWFGNFHKWAYAPVGTALLWASTERRTALRSLVVSWSEDLGFPAATMTTGTTDVTAWLAAPVGLEVLQELGADRLRAHNRRLVRYGQSAVGTAIDADLTGLDNGGLPMAIIPLPPTAGSTREHATDLQAQIADVVGVETAVSAWDGQLLLRLSAQAYNRPDDYDRLARGLPDVLRSRAR
jgi:isopenicillin-N epimerase